MAMLSRRSQPVREHHPARWWLTRSWSGSATRSRAITTCQTGQPQEATQSSLPTPEASELTAAVETGSTPARRPK